MIFFLRGFILLTFGGLVLAAMILVLGLITREVTDDWRNPWGLVKVPAFIAVCYAIGRMFG